jgi:hypothetical protein
MKRKFKILGQVAEYSINTQVDIVLALCGLYNFIRQHENIDQELEDIELEEEEEGEDIQEEVSTNIRGSGSIYMNKKRDEIAQQMWVDYQEYINK